MKCGIQILSLLIIIAVIDVVKCKPRPRVRKNINLEKPRLPIKHASFQVEKITPFGKYEFRHVINKRQAELPPREIPVIEGSLDDITVKKDVPLETLEPKVIITSIVEPVDKGKSLSLSSFIDPRFLITPVEQSHEVVELPAKEVVVAPKSEDVVAPVDIIPKPKEILLPPEPSVEPNVLINTVVEDLVPPPVRVPLYQNFNFPSPVIGNVGKPIMYTDITKIPLTVAPNPAPVVVPAQEVIVPPPPLPVVPVPPPSVVKEDPPKIKQETPNFFVKGSRLVLYVGSMMLQMLSRFVDGGFNFNQIPIPIIPGV